MAALAVLLGFVAPSYAQDTTIKKEGAVKKAGKKIGKGAKKAGHETAKLAAKGKAKLTDKTSHEWEGPNGQTIYIDDGHKYYWVDEKGARRWVTKDQLKPKTKHGKT